MPPLNLRILAPGKLSAAAHVVVVQEIRLGKRSQNIIEKALHFAVINRSPCGKGNLEPLEAKVHADCDVFDHLCGGLSNDTQLSHPPQVHRLFISVFGAFNVNSTSVVAWESLLKSLQGFSVPYDDPMLATGIQSDATGDNVPFPRNQLSSATSNTPWRGFRSLTATEINELAEAIVAEIRIRGPFRSLAQFVNRNLTASRGTNENLKGVLQAAIDNTSINSAWALPAVPQSQASPVSQYPEASAGPRSSAAPGYLTQGDLLQVLGPVVTARSDTFRIRAYGSSLNPLTGNTQAEAWCELIVQRMPDYLDPADAPEVFPAISSINEKFGRKFKIVGFRWLQSDEI